jgi:hypothetical protein
VIRTLVFLGLLACAACDNHVGPRAGEVCVSNSLDESVCFTVYHDWNAGVTCYRVRETTLQHAPPSCFPDPEGRHVPR